MTDPHGAREASVDAPRDPRRDRKHRGSRDRVAQWPAAVVGRPCAVSAPDWHRARLAETAEDDVLRRDYHAAWLRWLERPDDPGARPLVSVVIPAYEAEDFIAEAVRSALAQTWTPLEVVVVDDGSTTPAGKALAGSDERVRVVRQPNRGVASARNRGLREARGTLVQFLDADDSLRPDAIAAKMEALRCVPDAELAFSARTAEGANAFKRADEDDAHPIGTPECPTRDLLWAAVRRYPFHISAVLVCRARAFEVGGMDEDLPRCEDARFWFQLGVGATKVVAVDRPLSVRRLRPHGLTDDVPAMNYWKTSVALMNLRDLLARPDLWGYVGACKTKLHGTSRVLILRDSSDARLRSLRSEVVDAISRLAERGAAAGLSSGPCLASLETLLDAPDEASRTATAELLAGPIARARPAATEPTRRDLELFLACPPFLNHASLDDLYGWVDRQLGTRGATVRLGELPRLTAHWPKHAYRVRWEALVRLRPLLGDRAAVWLSASAGRISEALRRARMRLRLRTRLRALLGRAGD